MNKRRTVWTSLFFCFYLLGCGKGFQTSLDIGSNRSFFRESSSNQFIPESDHVNSSCAESAEMCLFLKNPVFQTQSLIPSDDVVMLKANQNFAAKLTNVDRSGYLKNENFNILSVSLENLKLSQALSGKGLTGDDGYFISAYYWVNRAHEYLTRNFTTYPSAQKKIKVFVDDSFDGFVWGKDSIHLNYRKKSSYSADVVLAILGEAQLGYATNGSVFNFSPVKHKMCPNDSSGDVSGCCVSELGCGKAILRGVGNYFVSMMFPDATQIGEFYGQNIKGQSICGSRFRSMPEFKDINFRQAFDLCGGNSGNVMAIGMVYASMWWEVRSQFDGKTVDEIFLKHLKEVTSEDTISTLIPKIQMICQAENQEAIGRAFQAEFLRRSL